MSKVSRLESLDDIRSLEEGETVLLMRYDTDLTYHYSILGMFSYAEAEPCQDGITGWIHFSSFQKIPEATDPDLESVVLFLENFEDARVVNEEEGYPLGKNFPDSELEPFSEVYIYRIQPETLKKPHSKI